MPSLFLIYLLMIIIDFASTHLSNKIRFYTCSVIYNKDNNLYAKLGLDSFVELSSAKICSFKKYNTINTQEILRYNLLRSVAQIHLWNYNLQNYAHSRNTRGQMLSIFERYDLLRSMAQIHLWNYRRQNYADWTKNKSINVQKKSKYDSCNEFHQLQFQPNFLSFSFSTLEIKFF